jgi:hypothetical protein
MPFETGLSELLDSEKLMAATVREQNKDIDDKTQGTGLRTTRSTSAQGNPNYLTMYTLSEILQGLPAVVSDAEVMKAHQDRLDKTVAANARAEGEGPLQGLLPFKGLLDAPGLLPESVRRLLEEGGAMGAGGTPLPAGSSAGATGFIEMARKEIGVTESPSGSNNNPYAAIAGHANGLAWCATFIAAMAKKAGVTLPSYSAATQTMEAAFKAANRYYETAEPGDIAFFDFNSNPSDGSVKHVAIVVDALANGTFRTIEGNTSSSLQGSQDNGGGVYEKIRDRNSITGFGRPNWPAVDRAASSGSTTTGGSTGTLGATSAIVNPGPGLVTWEMIDRHPSIPFLDPGSVVGHRTKFDQRVFWVIKFLADNATMVRWTNGWRAPSSSAHSVGRAADINNRPGAALVGPDDRIWVGRVYALLDSLTGPFRPTQVGGPYLPKPKNATWGDGTAVHNDVGGLAWFTNADHQDHIHIGY